MNLAFSDVLWLNQALSAFFNEGTEALMDSYQEDALDRIWKAQNYSYWMTSMLHIAPDATEFDKKRQVGELYSVCDSEYARQYVAEGYTGWKYGAAWK
jgi:p-hydroxybenzoate 3-monooxygenase